MEPVADMAENLELKPGEVEQLKRAAVRRGQPNYLWPTPPEYWRAALAEVARVAAAILAGQANVRLQRPPDVPQRAWPQAITAAAYTSCMGPILGYWQERGVLDADPAVAALLALQLVHGRARAERMERSLTQTKSVLDAAGLGLTLLKGTHTAHYCFAEPGVRPMSDHDVLVEPSAVVHAETALRAAGYVLLSRMARPYRTTWRPPGAPETVRSLSVHHAENPFTVDLHSSLDVHFGGVRTVRWPEHSGSRTAAPWPVSPALVLAQPLLVAYLAAHASLTFQNLTLLRLTELALLLQRDAENALRWPDLRELLRHAGAERFVYPAFDLVERFVPGTVDPELRRRLENAATPAMRALLHRLSPATAQRLIIAADEMFMWGASPADHLRRMAFALVPPAARSARSLGRLYFDRAVRLVRSGIPLRG